MASTKTANTIRSCFEEFPFGALFLAIPIGLVFVFMAATVAAGIGTLIFGTISAVTLLVAGRMIRLWYDEFSSEAKTVVAAVLRCAPTTANRALTNAAGAGIVIVSTYFAFRLILDAISLIKAGKVSIAEMLPGLLAACGMLIPLVILVMGARAWIRRELLKASTSVPHREQEEKDHGKVLPR